MTRIKASALLPVVVQLAKDNPDRMTGCTYFKEDPKHFRSMVPCCIVGHAFADFGVDPAPFMDDNELNQWTGIESLSGAGYLEEDDAAAVRKLHNIQSRQDKGDTWAEALTYAEEQEKLDVYRY